MKTIFSFLLLVVLAAGGYWLWNTRHASLPLPAPQPAAANQDGRPLSTAEQAVFLPLVCGGISAGSGNYAHDCATLTGYPSSDYGGDGLGLGITLTSVIYGHITDAGPAQAYVLYQGSFEPHVNNFGGGILFKANGNGGWALQKWIPGSTMDNCLALTPQGKTKLLCTSFYEGQGEMDTAITIWLPADSDGQSHPGSVLDASDLRQTMDPESNCSLRKSASQDVLLSIDGISRTSTGYAAQIEYVPAATAEAACKAKNFANAPATKSALALTWDGSKITVAPGFNFAPSS